MTDDTPDDGLDALATLLSVRARVYEALLAELLRQSCTRSVERRAEVATDFAIELTRTGGNQAAAARAVGLSPRSAKRAAALLRDAGRRVAA